MHLRADDDTASPVEPPPVGAQAGGVCSPEAAPLTLVQAVEDALECYPDAGRSRLKAITAHCAMHGHTDPDAVKRVYRAHTDAFALARRKVQSIAAPDDLAKAIRARQRSLARNIGKPREGYYRVLLAIADEERHRRGLPEVDVLTARSPKLPKPARRQKRSAPAAPEIHAEQLSLADAPAAAPSATGLIARLFARLQQPESPGAITSTA